MTATTKTSFGTKIAMAWGIFILLFGAYKCTTSVFGNEGSNDGGNGEQLSCNAIQSWQTDDDIINSLQGTWVMENEDYYGKRKFEFSGRSGKCWKMESGTTEWKEEGIISFEYSKRYDTNTKRNVGTEYIISYKAPIGSFSFDIDCVAGISVPSERYNYGISLLKID